MKNPYDEDLEESLKQAHRRADGVQHELNRVTRLLTFVMRNINRPSQLWQELTFNTELGPDLLLWWQEIDGADAREAFGQLSPKQRATIKRLIQEGAL